METTTHPEVPAASLYLSCLDSAIRSFGEKLAETDSIAITDRADAFYDALKAKSAIS